MSQPTHAPATQRGAALLTAMVIVSLIATMAAAMVWQQWRAIQIEAAERAQSQAQWILLGALDWARLILREDARDNVREGHGDHLGEPWAVPLADARLSTFLAADRDNSDDAPDAFLQGRITDLQSRYNLTNLVQRGKIVPVELDTLKRLCEIVGLSAQTADRLAEAMQRATPTSSAEVGEAVSGAASAAASATATSATPVVTPSKAMTTEGNTPLLPPGIEQLGWLGLDAASVSTLKPYVTLLPRATPLNLNTAAKEVIAAVVKGADLASAERLVQARLLKPLKTLDDARDTLGTNAALDPSRMGVASNYFEVLGALRTDDLIVAQRSLIERNISTLEMRTLRTERVDPASLQPQAAGR
ncbi:MAG: type II secretion system minor pseudopilin GspK [Leptothrix sp. (in: b-proteobacteria)]